MTNTCPSCLSSILVHPTISLLHRFPATGEAYRLTNICNPNSYERFLRSTGCAGNRVIIFFTLKTAVGHLMSLPTFKHDVHHVLSERLRTAFDSLNTFAGGCSIGGGGGIRTHGGLHHAGFQDLNQLNLPFDQTSPQKQKPVE